MCIICIKAAGKDLPSKAIVENMWYSNPDGAGLMYVDDNSVVIRKGYMALTDLERALDSLRREIDVFNTPIVLHFRIGTHGKNTAENTHPFPISENIHALEKTRARVPVAVAHNGIIAITPRKNISDTMEYILTQMSPLYKLKKDFYLYEAGLTLVKNAIKSKMAFLDGEGRIETIGDFITAADGLVYSNSSYLPMINYAKWDISATAPTMGNYKLLVWLSAKDGLIKLPDNSYVPSEDYMIDKKGRVYYYDWENDEAYEIDAVAYKPDGKLMKFDKNLATYMRTV